MQVPEHIPQYSQNAVIQTRTRIQISEGEHEKICCIIRSRSDMQVVVVGGWNQEKEVSLLLRAQSLPKVSK